MTKVVPLLKMVVKHVIVPIHLKSTLCVALFVCFCCLRKEPCNGLALWADFSFGEDLKISTGPVKEIVVGEKIDWDYYTRPGVHLIKHSKPANTQGDGECMVTVSIDFKVKLGDLKFAFQPSWIPRS